MDTEQDAWRTASKMERFRAENSGEPLQISATSSYTAANDYNEISFEFQAPVSLNT